jgi:stage II sporulation protein D
MRNSLRRLILLLLCCGIATAQSNAPVKTVRIGVFGLFHPKSLVVSPVPSGMIEITFDKQLLRIASDSPDPQLHIRMLAGELELSLGTRTFHAQQLQIKSDAAGPTNFVLSVPGKIHRQYQGTLAIATDGISLVPVVTMDVETAVASIVAAESPPGAPFEALKAQAVASRSYLVASKGRHGTSFDFCDTTHCQFLREPPDAAHPAAIAARQTAGLVLAFNDSPFAAMYSASCGGHTYSLAELGISSRDYPYYPVDCEYCKKNPEVWTRKLPSAEAAKLGQGTSEASRLRLARQLGWMAIPSNTYSTKSHGDEVELQGVGRGHGIGLCQRGAAAMAKDGADFRKILQHYYPNTSVTQISH